MPEDVGTITSDATLPEQGADALLAPQVSMDLLSYTGPHDALFSRLPASQQKELLTIFRDLDGLPKGLTITVGNLKGGVSKTTTAVFLALLLGLKGDSVLLVDCDSVN